MKSIWLGCVLSVATGLGASAQSVEVGVLDEASEYDAPISQQGGALDAELWRGTSADMAAKLISNAPLHDTNAIVTDLIKAAIFSGGVPPEGDEAAVTAYRAARLTAATALGQDKSVAKFIKNNTDLAVDPGINADIALAAGNTKEACHITDGVTEGRSEPKWARLRAFCHVIRGEAAAAELTTELLGSSGYEDPLYFELMDVLTGRKKTAKVETVSDDPLYAAMAGKADIKWTGAMPPSVAASTALNDEAKLEDRIKALYVAAPVLSDDQIKVIFASLSAMDASEDVTSFDYDSAVKEPEAKGTAQLYALSQSASSDETKARSIAEILLRADAAGAFSRMAVFLQPDILALSAKDQANANSLIFARAAVDRRDLSTLQMLHRHLNAKSRFQDRVALAADSLGNGFSNGALGKDIEERLGTPSDRRRAVRDVFVATAMGSRLSETAAATVADTGSGTGRPVKAGALLALKGTAKRGSRGETALRAAHILADGGPSSLDNDSLAIVVGSLQDAGLYDFAGRVAAEDFLSANVTVSAEE